MSKQDIPYLRQQLLTKAFNRVEKSIKSDILVTCLRNRRNMINISLLLHHREHLFKLLTLEDDYE